MIENSVKIWAKYDSEDSRPYSSMLLQICNNETIALANSWSMLV